MYTRLRFRSRTGVPRVAGCLLVLGRICIPIDGAYAQVTRDSAGVVIVENQRPAWTRDNSLRLTRSPTLTIGTQRGTAYQFSRIAGAAKLSDGTIVVADGGSKELRFFNARGMHVKSAGREGDGPGEFRDMRRFSRVAGDTLLAGDGSVGGR